MGQHVRDKVFRIVEVSVQTSGGSRACFIRRPSEHAAELDQFFERTGRDYKRFNYLGEWHSHPYMAPVPSTIDVLTMQSIVGDTSVGANFLVLIVLTLTRCDELRSSATVFQTNALPIAATISIEPELAPPDEAGV